MTSEGLAGTRLTDGFSHRFVDGGGERWVVYKQETLEEANSRPVGATKFSGNPWDVFVYYYKQGRRGRKVTDENYEEICEYSSLREVGLWAEMTRMEERKEETGKRGNAFLHDPKFFLGVAGLGALALAGLKRKKPASKKKGASKETDASPLVKTAVHLEIEAFVGDNSGDASFASICMNVSEGRSLVVKRAIAELVAAGIIAAVTDGDGDVTYEHVGGPDLEEGGAPPKRTRTASSDDPMEEEAAASGDVADAEEADERHLASAGAPPPRRSSGRARRVVNYADEDSDSNQEPRAEPDGDYEDEAEARPQPQNGGLRKRSRSPRLARSAPAPAPAPVSRPARSARAPAPAPAPRWTRPARAGARARARAGATATAAPRAAGAAGARACATAARARRGPPQLSYVEVLAAAAPRPQAPPARRPRPAQPARPEPARNPDATTSDASRLRGRVVGYLKTVEKATKEEILLFGLSRAKLGRGELDAALAYLVEYHVIERVQMDDSDDDGPDEPTYRLRRR